MAGDRNAPRPFTAEKEAEKADALPPFTTEKEAGKADALSAFTAEKEADGARGGGKSGARGARGVRTAADVASVGVMAALLLAVQYALSGVAGVELVTPLLLAYACTFGAVRGAAAAAAFSLLRCLLYGFAPNVVVLYLLYFPAFGALFGMLGRLLARRPLSVRTAAVALCAVAMTACFTLLDDVLTPWMLGYAPRAARAYFLLSLPVMAVQSLSCAVTVPLLYPPLASALRSLRRG